MSLEQTSSQILVPKDLTSSLAQCEALSVDLKTLPSYKPACDALARANASMAESKLLYALTSTKHTKSVQRGRVEEVFAKVEQQAKVCCQDVRALLLPGIVDEANTFLLHS